MSSDEEDEDLQEKWRRQQNMEEELEEEEQQHLLEATNNNNTILSSTTNNGRYVFRLSGFKTDPQPTTYYFIQVCAEDLGGKIWYIKKRYSQFDALRREFKKIVKSVPKLPGKRIVYNTEPNFLRERAKGLSTFLWNVASIPELTRSKALQDFVSQDVQKSPPTSYHPTTPLLSSEDGGTLSLAASPIPKSLTPTIPLDHTHQNNTDSSNNNVDNNADDGRWFIRHSNTAEDVQRGFASEGLTLAEGDIINEKDHGYRGATFTSGLSCSLFPFGRRNSRTESFSKPYLENNASSSSMDSYDVVNNNHGEDDGEEDSQDDEEKSPLPSLRIVIMLVGSRGDVQPYVALGKGLKEKGHIVRIAAHSCFKEWIEEHSLQFAPIAGDPKELLRMVVENQMFSYNFVKNGVTNHRPWVSQVLIDCWNACTQQDPYNIRKPKIKETRVGPGYAFSALDSKFRADFIIANPPSFAGWHCAEALGVPLLMSFPMPWTRTTEFPSPFTSLSAFTSSQSLNWLSYGAVDRLIWLGLGDLINKFRSETLKLQPIFTMSIKGHRYIHDYRVPFLYCWSPSVLQKPHDWEKHIKVSGYLFLNDSDGKNWKPNETLIKCFATTRPVVFIGFGSIVVKDPDRLSNLVSKAAKILIEKGFNVLVQKGWAGVEIEEEENLFTIGPAPHSWIFEKCAVVVHHGGSGTTAEGLRVGTPTVIVPFFGDQFFWGETIKRRELGDSEPYLSLTASRLVECVLYANHNLVKLKCLQVAKGINSEDGTSIAIGFIEHIVGAHREQFLEENNESWRKYPYHNLKSEIKRKRYENVKGVRKLKSRVKTVLGITTSLSFQKPRLSSQGLEMKTLVDQSSPKTSRKIISNEFPYLPEMFEGKVPKGHSTLSWFGKLNDDIPVGHTKFSWTAASW